MLTITHTNAVSNATACSIGLTSTHIRDLIGLRESLAWARLEPSGVHLIDRAEMQQSKDCTRVADSAML